MISKRLAFFLVVLTAGGIYGAMELERDRDVPRFPPEVAMRLGVGDGGVPALPPLPKPGPAEPAPNGGNGGGAEESPEPEPAPAPVPAGEGIRITNVELQGIESAAANPIADPGDNTFVVITISKDGTMTWGSTELGTSFEFLGEMMGQNAGTDGFRAVFAPDKNTPWKFVQWAMAAARENGVMDVYVAGFPDSDPAGTLLAVVNAGVIAGDYTGEIPEGMEQIKVRVILNPTGDVTYGIMGEEVPNAVALYNAASSWNNEWANFYGANYARKAGLSPWVILPDEEAPAGKVLRAISALRQCSVYSFRLNGDYGPPPGD
jgi:biopolymer transport protein ExbD